MLVNARFIVEEEEEVDVEAIARHMADLDEQEREIHTASTDSLAEWLARNYQIAIARAREIAPMVQHVLMTLGLG